MNMEAIYPQCRVTAKRVAQVGESDAYLIHVSFNGNLVFTDKTPAGRGRHFGIAEAVRRAAMKAISLKDEFSDENTKAFSYIEWQGRGRAKGKYTFQVVFQEHDGSPKLIPDEAPEVAVKDDNQGNWVCRVFFDADEVGTYTFSHEYVGARINALCFPYHEEGSLNDVVYPEESHFIMCMHKAAAAKLAVRVALLDSEYDESKIEVGDVINISPRRLWHRAKLTWAGWSEEGE